MQTTVGQLMINSVLPKHLQDHTRVMDKKGINALLERVADEKDPDLYRDVIHKLHQVGSKAAQSVGSSFSIYDLRTPPKTKRMMDTLKAKVTQTVERDDITSAQKEEAIANMVRKATPAIDETLLAEAKALGNPFATQVISGSRGGPADFRSLMVGDLLVTDHKDRVIPMPLLNSYAAGTDPAEYWAGAYGARKGGIATKLATQEAGFLAKQLVQASHRQVVTSDDCKTGRGIPVDVSDEDNIGTVLMEDVGDIKAGTTIDPRVQRRLKAIVVARKDEDNNITVRSPLTCEAPHGVCGKCVGIRERGTFPEIGDNVGIAAAQSLTEPLSQGALNVKHTGGRAKGNEVADQLTGFPLVNQLVQVPKSFRGGAAVSSTDGTVQSVVPAPQGGNIITIDGKTHYAPRGADISVKPGDRVEAGDVMSSGIPNPGELVKHRGIGAGRLDFVKIFQDAYKDSGLRANRRNIELMTRGLVNHVKVTDMDGVDNALPDDIIEYNSMEREYQPRYGFKVGKPKASVGSFLEKPVRQYTVGTRVTKRVADDLNKRGVKEITSHADAPAFQPHMVRAMQQLSIDPDWQVRLGGSYLQRGVLEALHRGRGSTPSSTSYIPGLARGTGFGTDLKATGKY